MAKIAITGHLYVVSSQAMLRRNETAWARPHSGATGIKSNTGTSQTWEIKKRNYFRLEKKTQCYTNRLPTVLKMRKMYPQCRKPSGADLSRTLARQLFESFVARDPSSKIWQNIRPTLDPATRISTEMCSKGPSTSSTSNIWTPSPSIWSNDLGILRPDPSHHSSDLAAGRNICHPSFFPHLEVS